MYVPTLPRILTGAISLKKRGVKTVAIPEAIECNSVTVVFYFEVRSNISPNPTTNLPNINIVKLLPNAIAKVPCLNNEFVSKIIPRISTGKKTTMK